METLVFIGLVVVGIYLYRRASGDGVNSSPSFARDRNDAHDNDDQQQYEQKDGGIKVEVFYGDGPIEEQVVEIVTDDGLPAFKFRYHADLVFTTPSESLRKHRAEEFIPRPNGNRDSIEEGGGRWLPVSRFDRPGWGYAAEDERFKYIGGVKVYIDLLLAVRAVYENKGIPPSVKRTEIKRICEHNHLVYTVQHVYQPPWEALIVPVLSLADGFGPHRVGILEAAGIRSIHDVDSRSDEDLLAIKGIGKAAVAGLRNLASHWLYDRHTDCIERDEKYRSALVLAERKD